MTTARPHTPSAGDLREYAGPLVQGFPDYVPLACEIDHERDVALVHSVRRTVAVPRRVFRRLMDSQAGKDWSDSVCERICRAAHEHPRLIGATVEGAA